MARPVTVTVGPLATADADGAALSQTAATISRYLAINGALTNGGTANNVCQSQTPSTTFTLNGTLASSVPTGTAVAYLGYMRRIYFTCAGNESAKSVTIVGTGMGPSGAPFAVTETLTLSNTSIVASRQTYYTITSLTMSSAAAGAITVGAAGLATFDTPRRVIVTSGGNDTGITFTLYGTDATGNAITEVLTGASGAAAQSALDYKTLTDVLTSGAVATTVTVGTNGVASSQWVRFDDYAGHSQVSIQVTASGTVNYTVQQTLDDPNNYPAYVTVYDTTWVNHPDSNLVGATGTVQGNYGYRPAYARILLNSGTGSLRGQFNQAFTGH